MQLVTNYNIIIRGDKLLLNASYSGSTSKDYRDRSPQYENKKDKTDSLWLRG